MELNILVPAIIISTCFLVLIITSKKNMDHTPTIPNPASIKNAADLDKWLKDFEKMPKFSQPMIADQVDISNLQLKIDKLDARIKELEEYLFPQDDIPTPIPSPKMSKADIIHSMQELLAQL